MSLAAVTVACSGPQEPPPSTLTTPQLLERAAAQRGRGDLASAVAAYRMVIHRDSLNADALGGLAAVYGTQGRSLAADRYLRKAIHLTYSRGQSALSEGDSAGAVAAFEKTLTFLPRHPLALLRLGDVAYARGDAEGAIDWYRRAASANPDLAESHIKLGAACVDAGREAEARDAYESAIRANINAFEAYVGLGGLDAASGDWAAAAEQYGKALKVRPQSSAAMNGLSRARQNL